MPESDLRCDHLLCVLYVGTDLGAEIVERHLLSTAFAGHARDAAVDVRDPSRRDASLAGGWGEWSIKIRVWGENSHLTICCKAAW